MRILILKQVLASFFPDSFCCFDWISWLGIKILILSVVFSTVGYRGRVVLYRGRKHACPVGISIKAAGFSERLSRMQGPREPPFLKYLSPLNFSPENPEGNQDVSVRAWRSRSLARSVPWTEVHGHPGERAFFWVSRIMGAHKHQLQGRERSSR